MSPPLLSWQYEPQGSCLYALQTPDIELGEVSNVTINGEKDDHARDHCLSAAVDMN